SVGVDGDADVDVLLVDHAVVVEVERGVDRRVPPQRLGAGTDDERHGRETEVDLLVERLGLLTHGFEVGDIGIVEVGHVRRGLLRLRHLRGDGLTDLAELFEADRSPVILTGLAGRDNLLDAGLLFTAGAAAAATPAAATRGERAAD